MEKKYCLENMDNVDTFESYYMDLYLSQNQLLIPYVNVGIFDHPINPLSLQQMKHLNRSYLLFNEVAVILKNGQLIHASTVKEGFYQVFSCGGISILPRQGNSLDIFSKQAFLLLEKDYQLSDNYKTFSLSQSFLDERTKSFFSLKTVSSDLSALMPDLSTFVKLSQ